jgi:hypothetical protein
VARIQIGRSCRAIEGGLFCLLLPANQSKTGSYRSQNNIVLRFMCARHVESKPIDWSAVRPKRQEQFHHAITACNGALCAMELADESRMNFRPARFAVVMCQLEFHAIVWCLPLETIRLAEYSDRAAGRERNSYAAFRPSLVACNTLQPAWNLDRKALSRIAVSAFNRSGLSRGELRAQRLKYQNPDEEPA